MGSLRFFLAFAVFNAHAGLPLGTSLLAGSTAVHCFFVISGFYMAMVLGDKYATAGYGTFVTNRILRLMPSYLAVMGATLVYALWLRGKDAGELAPLAALDALSAQGLPVWVQGLSATSQLLLLGQDVFSFLAWSGDAGVTVVTAEQGVSASLQSLMLVPPAWSLSLELYFYLLAPWLVRRPLALLWYGMAASLLCRLVLSVAFDWRVDPWSYRFFPSELLFFISGVVCFRLGEAARRAPGAWMLTLAGVGGLLGLVEVAGIYQQDMGIHKWARVPLFGLLCTSLPLLFEWTRNWRWDRALGELSYPLYICHFLVIWIVQTHMETQSATGRLTLLLSALGLAMVLRRWVDVPVDRYRQRRLQRVHGSARTMPG